MSNGLLSLIRERNRITVKEDESCEMAEVDLNGTNIFTGNYWDYHPGCQGNVVPKKYKWNGREEFVNSLKQYIEDLGKKVKIKEKKYKYRG